MSSEIKVVACNVALSTKVFPPGARCYVVDGNTGWGGETSIEIYGRSRSGRWVRTWVRTRRLYNFRVVCIQPEDPRYRFLSIYRWWRGDDGEMARWLSQFEQYAREQRERNGLKVEDRK